MTTLFRTFAGIAMASLVVGCAKKPSSNEESSGGGTSSTTHIYVSSGTVYAGNGITPATASKTIAKYTIDGTFVSLIKDYTGVAADSPAHIINYDSTRLISLVENSAGRRVEYINKDVGDVTSIFSNIANLNGVVRSFILDYSNQFLIGKTTAIEKMTFSGSQTLGPSGGTFINNPASCGTLNTSVADIVKAPSGSDFVIFSHAAASPNNKVAVIKKTGYGVAADCLASIASPSANHYPTALLMHSSGVLFVAFSNSTGSIHQVYALTPTFTSTTATLGSYPGSPALNDMSLGMGISRMTEMPDGSILIASAAPTMNVIERFTYSSGVLTRVGTSPFIGPTVFTKSISGIVIGE